MQSDDNKDAVLASTNTENGQTPVQNKDGIIRAEGLQDKVSAVQKRDLSAIIPEKAMEGSEANLALQSREKILNSDGSVVIGNIDNGNLVLVNGAKYPDKIDIQTRKKQKQDALKAKKNIGVNKVKKKMSEEDKKAQNITSLIVLLIIGLLGLFGYYFFNRSTEADFKVKNITIELGESLPVQTNNYVIPANIFKVGSFDFSKLFKKDKYVVDDLDYSINTSLVKIDEVGEYDYQVTHEGVVKNGKITIKDTTPPVLKLREVRIIEGNTYTPQSFISSCNDLSGCSYEFENQDMANYSTPNNYEVVIKAIDPYNNEVKEKISLVIESKGDVKVYKKGFAYSEEQGYSLTSTYEIHLSLTNNKAQILLFANLTEEYLYQDENRYKQAVKSYEGDSRYSFDNKKLTITKNERVNNIGSSPNIVQINEYLLNNGYTEIQ